MRIIVPNNMSHGDVSRDASLNHPRLQVLHKSHPTISLRILANGPLLRPLITATCAVPGLPQVKHDLRRFRLHCSHPACSCSSIPTVPQLPCFLMQFYPDSAVVVLLSSAVLSRQCRSYPAFLCSSIPTVPQLPCFLMQFYPDSAAVALPSHAVLSRQCRSYPAFSCSSIPTVP